MIMASKYIIKRQSDLFKMSVSVLKNFVRQGSKTAMSKVKRLQNTDVSGFSQTIALYEEFKPHLKGKSLGYTQNLSRDELILRANAISNIMLVDETPAKLAKMISDDLYDEWLSGTFGEWENFEDFVSDEQTKSVIRFARDNEAFLRSVIDTSDDPELQDALEYVEDNPDKYYVELVRISSKWAKRSAPYEIDELRSKYKYRDITSGKRKDRRKKKK